MVIARELSRPILLLIAAQPTRGIDVGSIEFIHQQIVAKRDEGVAVLLVSSELDEILALSDRIVVMYRGSIIGEVDGKDATRQQLGLLMVGVRETQKRSTTTWQKVENSVIKIHRLSYLIRLSRHKTQ